MSLWLLIAAIGGPLAATPVAAEEIVDQIVAVVNDDVILLSDLKGAMQPYLERLEDMPYPTQQAKTMKAKLREDVVSQLVDQQLTDQEVQRLGIRVTSAEIEAALARVKEANFYTDADLAAAVRERGQTMAEYRREVREQILRGKLVNYEIKSKTIITDADVRAYYEANPEQFGRQRRYHLRHILLKPDRDQRPAADDPDPRRRQILEQLAAGASFADLARRYSQAPLAAEGGDLGEMAPSTLAPVLREAVTPLAAGEHSDWIETDLGWQLFYVEAILETPGKPLESVAADIQDRLYTEIVNERFHTWLEELRQRSHIHILR